MVQGADHVNKDDIPLLPYYVYELRDPRNNEVFYVGKGQGNRAYRDTAKEENETGVRSADIERAGHSVLQVIVGRWGSEAEAFAVESVLIKWVYGFNNLTNRVHGHGHRNVRDHAQMVSGNYRPVPGIDQERRVGPQRDGGFTAKQRDQIAQNQVFEKLEALRDDLHQRPEFAQLDISDPDLSTPADPCILVSGFQPSTVQLQIKMQLTGKTVVLNFVRSQTSSVEAFENALTGIAEPFEVKHGNPGFGGRYTQTHDFVSRKGQYPRGIKYDDLDTIVRLSREAIDRLNTPAP